MFGYCRCVPLDVTFTQCIVHAYITCTYTIDSPDDLCACVCLFVCVMTGRSGVVQIHHTVLLQRGSRSSAGVRHHKVRYGNGLEGGGGAHDNLAEDEIRKKHEHC